MRRYVAQHMQEQKVMRGITSYQAGHVCAFILWNNTRAHSSRAVFVLVSSNRVVLASWRFCSHSCKWQHTARAARIAIMREERTVLCVWWEM